MTAPTNTRAIAIVITAVAAFAAAIAASMYRDRTPSIESQVSARVAEYDRLVLAMNSEGIADLFAANGEMWTEGEEPKRGPEAIARYLHSFEGQFRVESQKTTIQRMVTSREAAEGAPRDVVVVFAAYQQTARVLSNNTIAHADGDIRTEWVRCEPATWCIRRAETTPRRSQ